MMYDEFMEVLRQDYPEYAENIGLQNQFRENTLKTAYTIRNLQGNNVAQVRLLQQLIQNGTESDLTRLNDGKGIPLAANLNMILQGVKVEKTKVFTSATKPLLLPFYYRLKGRDEQEPETFTMMFKTGDDMRQDALILQLFSIMDRVLSDVGLEL